MTDEGRVSTAMGRPTPHEIAGVLAKAKARVMSNCHCGKASDGHVDGYCKSCSDLRCDAYPGACDDTPSPSTDRSVTRGV